MFDTKRQPKLSMMFDINHQLGGCWLMTDIHIRGGRYDWYIGILRCCEKTVCTEIRFCNSGISAISGIYRLFPLIS